MAPGGLCVQPSVVGGKTYWIAPFGNLRIKVYLPLPEAYRSLSRPSSPDGAKASVVRPYTLSRKILIKLKPSRSVYVAFFFPETFNCQRSKIHSNHPQRVKVVGVPGIEPGTSSLSGTRSNQLSYTPDCVITDTWSGRGATEQNLCQVHLAYILL